MKKFFVGVALAAGMVFSAGASADGHAKQVDSEKLEKVLAAQPNAMKARYKYRHPKETLEFFGVAPGMTVADTLAGEYYSRILLPYLGDDGKLIGVSYSVGQREIDHKNNAERMQRYRAWPQTYVERAEEWRQGSKAEVSSFLFDAMPEDVKGTVDVFLVIRAMHHLHKYNDADNGERLNKALADMYAALKPGGVLGIVQHRAPEGRSEDWARGFNGYVKESALIKAVKAAGFEFVAKSDINANPMDKPTENDKVWRLLPVNRDGDANVGESDRMTLKFRKPE